MAENFILLRNLTKLNKKNLFLVSVNIYIISVNVNNKKNSELFSNFSNVKNILSISFPF